MRGPQTAAACVLEPANDRSSMTTPPDRADRHLDHLTPPAAPGIAIGRRDLLRGAAALGITAGFGVAAPLVHAARRVDDRLARSPARGKAKNLIFMVSDGMSFGTLTLGDMLTRRATGKPGAWASVWARPGTRRAAQMTHSKNSLVTDSAAAASAWSSGVHINSGSINVTPEGVQLLPIFAHAQQYGKAVGAVTTTRVTHATPAGFYANSPRRDYEGLIAEEALERRVDVLMGGGERFFAPSLIQKHSNYQVVRTSDELKAVKPEGPLLGLFSESHVPYVLDRAASVPDLTTMATIALDRLSTRPEGFILQIEAGRVDHAAHDNDAAGLVGEQMEFERTIAAVWAWLEKRNIDDTLLIITSDHGNANPGLTLYGEEGEQGMQRLTKARRSFEWIHDQLSEHKGVAAKLEQLPKVVQEASGHTLTPSDVDMLAATMRDERVAPFDALNPWPNVLGGILANHYGVGFISKNHSADYVETTAIGPGSDLLIAKAQSAGGVIDNIDLHTILVDAMGLGAGTLSEDMKAPMPLKSVPKPD